MNPILFRIAVIIFAVGFTVITFNFWGDFSRAMNNYLTMTTKEDPPPEPTGVVTMTIIQPKTGPTDRKPNWDCNKKNPCPKP